MRTVSYVCHKTKINVDHCDIKLLLIRELHESDVTSDVPNNIFSVSYVYMYIHTCVPL